LHPNNIKRTVSTAAKTADVQPIFLWGAPGIGKSAVVKQVTEELEIGLCDMRLAQRDPTDLRGIPAVIDGKARWLPPPELPTECWCLTCGIPLHASDLVQEGKKISCRHCKDDKFTDEGILFLDELSSAPPLTQASAYQLTLDRRIGEYILPENWYIMAAGNRIEDRAVTFPMSKALANRFTHLTFETTKNDWISWAYGAAVSSLVIAFIGWKPSLLYPEFNAESSEKAFPTPRTWEFASNILKMKLPDSIQAELLEGTVGQGAALELTAFKKLQTQLPDLDKILKGENIVPEKLDLKYALVTALVEHATTKQYERLLQYTAHLGAEFSVMMVMFMIAKDFKAVGACPSWEPWSQEHASVVVKKRSA